MEQYAYEIYMKEAYIQNLHLETKNIKYIFLLKVNKRQYSAIRKQYNKKLIY